MDDYLPQATISGETKPGHERNTLVLKGLVIFAVALFGVGIVVEYGLGFVMQDFSREEKDLEALKPPTFPDDSGPFPGPRLQAEPSTDFQKMRNEALHHLNGYGWVDRKAGIAHIPIDRAMEIVARSGLPSAVSAGASGVGASPESKPLPTEAAKTSEYGSKAGQEAMSFSTRVLLAAALGVGCLLAVATEGRAQKTVGGVVSQVGFDQKLGVQLPLDLRFRDDTGRDLRLGELCGRRPLILAPVYFRCPLLCNQLLNGLTRSLKPVSLAAGRDFDVIAFSINPAETPELAGPKRKAYLEQYDRPGSANGWHFLVGDQSAITALTEAIGFRYTFNPQTELFAHAAGVVIVTPDGKIARYFYGIDFPPKELESELGRARAGRIGNPIGRLLLLCYDYDAATGKYTLSIMRLLRIAGTATAVALGAFVCLLLRHEAKTRRKKISEDDRTWPTNELAHGSLPRF